MAASFVDAGRAEGDFSGCYLCAGGAGFRLGAQF